jgi:CIC family chloride channel protein
MVTRLKVPLRSSFWILAGPRDLTLLVLGAVIGIVSGVIVSVMGLITEELHALLFGIELTERLSEQRALLHPALILVPCVGGVLIGLSLWTTRKLNARLPVDPIEANALHGGRMAMGESLVVAIQTIISSGFGASVGLEAGYTQASASIASRLALALGLRRGEVRMLVGCGAAGAISAAFDAPITGAFYAFELIVGTYSIMLVGPVIAAALTARLTAGWLGIDHIPIDLGPVSSISPADLPAYIGLGILGGLAAVATMRLVSIIELGFRASACPLLLRPVIGGLIVGVFGYISPQVLSSGHGALHLELALTLTWQALLFLFCLKAISAALSLGAGFRGGLFFSSLFLGSLLGKLFAAGTAAMGLWPAMSPMVAAVVGMSAMAVGAVGGPLTMTFLALESTGNLMISAAVLVASIASAIIVRETFGYSFSTWRLHLRGETIRSAHDIGRMRNLTVAGLLRANFKSVAVNVSLDDFCRAFPLGSGQRVIALDADGLYAGIIIVTDAHAALTGNRASGSDLRGLATYPGVMLVPSMTAEEAARLFQAASSEELAVVDSPKSRRVLGLVTEQHLLRRYAEELEKARKDLAGGD